MRLKMWARLKSDGGGWPIIVGGDQQLEGLVKAIDERAAGEPVADILTKAARLHHPDELTTLDAKKRAEIREMIRADLAQPDEKLNLLDIGDDGEVIQLTPD